ncbi:Gfo/Idh/MocA family protein [Paenibacillus ginsengarvi]|uniref:Gfo/Idh/MocA family oxidoreductase n=1 Tax=Paenibacillus ginsengarvi TaxID=400777 RepID=A0A3B0C0E8_9BACL|nr:Gfo/Idh/MocA family oxidoreductase [Paenibacillus ginsengarvi]RKN78251.1 gfo/Idh/MocA family oxidoreductase [Paenibacillus ginsengarvi]
MSKYRAAVIGLGYIGLKADIPRKHVPLSHSLAYRLNPHIEFAAAAGVRREQGEMLALLAPETKFYMDLDTMLSEQQLDLISICTPEHVRLELLRTVLSRSEARVLFLEKPVATTVQEAEAIAELAKRYKRTVVVNFSRRWSEGVRQIRQAVVSGEFGTLTNIHVRYTRGIGNNGSHLFDLIRFTAGPIAEVQVVRQVATNMDRKDDPTFSFLFSLDGGVPGYAEAFDDRHFLMFEMDLYFDKGKIELLRTGDDIRFYTASEHASVQGKHLTLKREETNLLARVSLIQLAVEHIVDIAQYGAAPVCTLDDGLCSLYVADALIRSHQNSGAVQTVKRIEK